MPQNHNARQASSPQPTYLEQPGGSSGSPMQSFNALHHESDKAPGSAVGSEDSSLGDLCSKISSMITLLYRILMAVRPTSGDKSAKYSGVDVSHWEFFDHKHVQDKFPSADRFILSRLGQASVQRRQFFEYQKCHRAKLAPERLNIARHVDGEQEEGTIVTTMSTLVDLCPTGGNAYGKSPQSPAAPEAGSDEGGTETSYGSTMGAIVAGGCLRVPAPPNSVRAYEGVPFECPYCLYIVTTPNFQAWQ